MALQKLYYVYGLDTACFYTDEENGLEKRIIKARCHKRKIKAISKFEYSPKFLKRKLSRKEITRDEYKQLRVQWCEKTIVHYHKICQAVGNLYDSSGNKAFNINKYIADKKDVLKQLLNDNLQNGLVRTVREDRIYDKSHNPSLRRRVSIFDSSLTRYFGLKEREFNTEIVIVKVYFFDVAQSIVEKGFYLNGYKYKFFSASAGQIRSKKLVAVREDLLNKYWNSLTAGLTVEKINQLGGMNINKYLAYLALCNSATDLWQEFDIDRCIVVDDFENIINGMVDFIDEKTYNIERVQKDLEFTQTDGVGMILPSLADKNFMIRLPWIKGLLAKFDFVKFIQDHNATGDIIDIYGTKHNVLNENIQIIFTKSQLKMWKFFTDWNEYKENFKKYNCTAGICNEEEDSISESVINYQMIQTLSDMTDGEIRSLAKNNSQDISDMSNDVKTMLKIFGATSWNKHKTGLQKCLEIYPELLSDAYCRQTLRDLKTKLEKELWSARFDMGGKYTFVIPDLYAFCERLFLGIDNPKGLLNSDEVCCKLYKHGEKLDCLRSPHLYLEHPVRVNNTKFDWFDTQAIYISSHDLISRIVQCDFDGDKLLVTNNSTLIEVAERNTKKFNIVPLFYNMSKAAAEEITPQNLFKGLKLAYNGGNIGTPSNDITKIWNSGEINEEKLKVIKWLVAEVNYTIDYAKTLYKPKRPKFADRLIKKYTKAKTPCFFQSAKGKKENQVEKSNESVVNRIQKLYPTKRLSFNFKDDNIGKFDYKVLINNPDVKITEEIGRHYRKISKSLSFSRNANDNNMNNYLAVFDEAKKNILSLPYDNNIIIDNIIIDLFTRKYSTKKKAFWIMFGNEVYENIKNNLDDKFAVCDRCGKRFYKANHRQKYCESCKGYKPKATKTIICCDCGKEFAVSGSNKRTIRCEECQHEVDKSKKIEINKKYYENHKLRRF